MTVSLFFVSRYCLAYFFPAFVFGGVCATPSYLIDTLCTIAKIHCIHIYKRIFLDVWIGWPHELVCARFGCLYFGYNFVRAGFYDLLAHNFLLIAIWEKEMRLVVCTHFSLCCCKVQYFFFRISFERVRVCGSEHMWDVRGTIHGNRFVLDSQGMSIYKNDYFIPWNCWKDLHHFK